MQFRVYQVHLTPHTVRHSLRQLPCQSQTLLHCRLHDQLQSGEASLLARPVDRIALGRDSSSSPRTSCRDSYTLSMGILSLTSQVWADATSKFITSVSVNPARYDHFSVVLIFNVYVTITEDKHVMTSVYQPSRTFEKKTTYIVHIQKLKTQTWAGVFHRRVEIDVMAIGSSHEAD